MFPRVYFAAGFFAPTYFPDLAGGGGGGGGGSGAKGLSGLSGLGTICP